ncbi:hypothetical protein MXD81_30660 [Microbacteriaceae bacterium K1510]|nr:hypothetical protein [Microbacteriaceae bacterium K1510]
MRNRRRTLREALATVSDAAPIADPFDTKNTTTAGAEPDRRGILVRVSPDLRRRLKLTAINRGTTVQALLLEAITEALKAPDRSPTP